MGDCATVCAMKSISRFPRWGAVLAVLLFGGFAGPGRRRRRQGCSDARRHMAHEARRPAAGEPRWPMDRRAGDRAFVRRQQPAQRPVAHRHQRAQFEPPPHIHAPPGKRRHLESGQSPYRLQRAARQRRSSAALFARPGRGWRGTAPHEPFRRGASAGVLARRSPARVRGHHVPAARPTTTATRR